MHVHDNRCKGVQVGIIHLNAHKHWRSQGKLLEVVWKIFTILSPKLVLAYAEDISSDSRLKICAKYKTGWCKSVDVEHFEVWVKKDIIFFAEIAHEACQIGSADLQLLLQIPVNKIM